MQQEPLEEGFFPRFIDRPRLIGIFEIDEFFLGFIIIAGIIATSLAFPDVGSLPVMLLAIGSGLSAGYFYKLYSSFFLQKRNLSPSRQ